jgi:nucleoside-diphosphate-sugar epimerase
MRAFIIGASGQLGSAIAQRLIGAGWQVTCAQRGDALPHLVQLGAANVRLDRDEPGALRNALGPGADAVIDLIAYEPHHARQLLELADVVGQFVVITSASVYRDARGRTLDEAKTHAEFPELPVPIDETQPTVDAGPQTYSTKKVAIERILLDESPIPASIIRPCAIYGPHTKHAREWWFVKRWLDGRRHVPLKFADSIFHTSATPNIAEVVRVALAAAFHGVLNAGDRDAPSVREIATIIARALGWECEFVSVADAGPDVGETPWSTVHPFVLCMDAAARLGYAAQTSYARFAAPTCRALIEAARGNDWRAVFPVLEYYPNLFDYAAEDAFLNARNTAHSPLGLPDGR